jgi:uncharacterized RDD family membrane protein YckC
MAYYPLSFLFHRRQTSNPSTSTFDEAIRERSIMNCPNCTVSISEDDHRCSNCGRRLGSNPGPLLATRTATALRLDTVATTYAEPKMAPRPRLEYSNDDAPKSRPRHAAALQSTLFAMHEERKVRSIDGYEDTAAAPKRQRRQPTERSSYLPYQGVLEFVPVGGPAPRTLPTSVEAVIYCDYPVATRTHRALAGLIDFVIVLGCMLLFLGIVYFGCEGMPWLTLDTMAISMIALATGLLGLLYEAYWVLSGVPSPGMDCVGLRLVHFDGNEPSQADNTRRILGGFISVAAAFIGLAWAFVDEECLTWQDHISRTFPTPVRAQYGIRR